MVGARSKWEDELGGWLKPFLDRLGHKARRRMCPLYVAGLIGPGDRKSVQPMAERLAPGDYDRLHHFVAAGVWDAAPLEAELLVQADRLVGGSDAVLVGEAHVASAEGAHAAVEPRLGGDPVRCVPPVPRFGEVAVRATRPVRAPARLQDIPIAAGGELWAHGRGEVDPAVRRSLQDGGGVGDAHWVVDVGQQHRPIRHRDLDVPLDLDFVGALPHADPLRDRAPEVRRRTDPMSSLVGLEPLTPFTNRA